MASLLVPGLHETGAGVNIPLGRTLLFEGSCFSGGEPDTSIGIFAVMLLSVCVVFTQDFCRMEYSLFTRYVKERFTDCVVCEEMLERQGCIRSDGSMQDTVDLFQ